MTTLVLPVSGKSSRFHGMLPKWLLTMPCGNLMIEKSISKLDLSKFSKIVIICLKEHIEKYLNFEKLHKSFNEKLSQEIVWIVLEHHTASQAETIVRGLEKANITGSFFVKDCDNEFEYSGKGENEVAVVDLNKVELIDAKNKSYVQTNELGDVTNIVEKNVISNLFCCGGYGFESASNFIKTFNFIKSQTTKEIYVSHVIYKMLIDGDTFKAIHASAYADWGTAQEYLSYTQKHVTVFCDVDGVLLKNGSWFGKSGWNTDPILENISALKALQDKGLLFLVITSSRPISEKEKTLNILKSIGLSPNESLFGLPHNRRILINNYSNINPYPSALSINLEQDSVKLKSLFASIK